MDAGAGLTGGETLRSVSRRISGESDAGVIVMGVPGSITVPAIVKCAFPCGSGWRSHTGVCVAPPEVYASWTFVISFDASLKVLTDPSAMSALYVRSWLVTTQRRKTSTFVRSVTPGLDMGRRLVYDAG